MVTKTIAITMGDPAGIGPEIIVKRYAKMNLMVHRWWWLGA